MAYLQLEALRQASVGFAVGWQLASVRRYAVVVLSSCPFGSSSQDGFDDLLYLQAGCLKECSISSNSGDVDRDVLAELLVSGLEAFKDGCELLSDDVSDEELSVPLVLVLSLLELPDGELGKDTEDSLVVVSDTGCELVGLRVTWDDGCGSLRSECLVVTPVCLIGMSRSGSVTFSLNSLLFLVEVSRPGCLLGGIDTVLVTGLSSNLVILAHLLSWTLLSGTVSETKT